MRKAFYKTIHKNIGKHEPSADELLIISHVRYLSALPQEDLLREFDSSADGLSPDAVNSAKKKFGRNVVSHDKEKPWYVQLIHAFNNPFNLVLFILAAVSLSTGDREGVLIIVVMVLLSVVIKFTQEYKSGKSAAALRALVHTTCMVKRTDDQGVCVKQEILMEELLPGDIVVLAAGDIIPADLRILHSKDLFISQSALTGEALPVEKKAGVTSNNQESVLMIENICFMGTNVDIGSAEAIVLATGSGTYFGAMASSLTQTKVQTSFDVGINKVSWILVRFMLVLAPVVFFISGFTKGSWVEALLFALSVAVGLTPEMLPVVVTANLAKGAMRMAKDKVVVKRLNSIQNFGAMNVLCTDKTGTLTEDRIVLIKHLDPFGRESEQVLQYAFQNSFFQSGLKNMVDMAILKNEELQGREALENEWIKVDEIPFDFIRRKMSVVLQNKQTGKFLLICKGAVEEMIASSVLIDKGNGAEVLGSEDKQRIVQLADEQNADGLRLLAVGHKYYDVHNAEAYTVKDESDLVLDGFVAFLDPPKASAKEALAHLKDNGIQVKVLTGDNDIVARKVCKEVGLDTDNVVKGSEIDKMADDQLATVVVKNHIFAKLTPLQKSRIVASLRKQNFVVGFMGDGINDAPSLRESDVGISVDTAVDISKESADLILLQKSLNVLNDGVVEGRKTFANTMKYIKITASSNFGNVFSMLGASALFPFLPMLPLQILILNMLYDLSQISLPWDQVDRDYLKKPRKWEASDIQRFMLYMGPPSSFFDYLTFGVLFWVFGANTIEHQAVFQTGWFLESLVTQTLIVQVLRTEKIPFIESRPSRVVVGTACLLLCVGFVLPNTPIGVTLGFTSMPWHFYMWLVVISMMYLFVTNLIKRWYIRKFSSWL
ncbi:MAG: magnesium-translocating P-type ATPase [Tannerellaceae bacterium]